MPRLFSFCKYVFCFFVLFYKKYIFFQINNNYVKNGMTQNWKISLSTKSKVLPNSKNLLTSNKNMLTRCNYLNLNNRSFYFLAETIVIFCLEYLVSRSTFVSNKNFLIVQTQLSLYEIVSARLNNLLLSRLPASSLEEEEFINGILHIFSQHSQILR